jgi:Na+/H+ antiporter NhaD/arsenite permease-like protein
MPGIPLLYWPLMTGHELAIPLWASIPFLLMLLSIAILPLAAPDFWELNRNKLIVAVGLSLPVIGYFLVRRAAGDIGHTLLFDYVPFIILLGALFTITGGIHLAGDVEARPRTNTVFLALGAVLASFMGTTGAAMLLIRPVISTNRERHYKTHTVLFFIGIVANTGGLLTPLGDPPLFMMYLRGAPFTWFFRLLPEWLFVNAVLLAAYFLLDSYYYRREPAENLARDRAKVCPMKLLGRRNFLFLLGVVLAVAFLNEHYIPAMGTHRELTLVRDGVILALAVASYAATTKQIRYYNRFVWAPIVEVAYLFLGIFVTMVPCLLYLETHARTLGVRMPAQFYYATGALSSFLDNTPTAVTFHSLALGLGAPAAGAVAGIPAVLLRAICTGAVFFGSMTYIGNGPNFMVRCVAVNHSVRMPHFFAYMVKFSLIYLLPVFILNHFLFVR